MEPYVFECEAGLVTCERRYQSALPCCSPSIHCLAWPLDGTAIRERHIPFPAPATLSVFHSQAKMDYRHPPPGDRCCTSETHILIFTHKEAAGGLSESSWLWAGQYKATEGRYAT